MTNPIPYVMNVFWRPQLKDHALGLTSPEIPSVYMPEILNLLKITVPLKRSAIQQQGHVHCVPRQGSEGQAHSTWHANAIMTLVERRMLFWSQKPSAVTQEWKKKIFNWEIKIIQRKLCCGMWQSKQHGQSQSNNPALVITTKYHRINFYLPTILLWDA